MQVVKLACEAMATRFEVALPGDDPVRLRAAGEEALEEVQRLEETLSLYRPTSEIARVNRAAGRAPVPVSAPVFELLQLCVELWGLSEGAFDITVAPLVRAWGFMHGRGREATPAEVSAARERVGMQYLELDAAQRTVRFLRPGMMLDLGAVGKGHALDVAAEVLREAGVVNALIHSGTSSCYGLGRAESGAAWRVAIEDRDLHPASARASQDGETTEPARVVAVAALSNEALSVSGVEGKALQTGGRRLGHVIDPRSGEPVAGAPLAAVKGASAAETDALSTALLLLGEAGLEVLGRKRTDLGLLMAGVERSGAVRVQTRGWPAER